MTIADLILNLRVNRDGRIRDRGRHTDNLTAMRASLDGATPATEAEIRAAIDARDIETLIRAAFPQAKISVQGDDGSHFAAEVIDASFKGMNRVQQQRAVYASLKGKMDGPNGALHALALTTKAPD